VSRFYASPESVKGKSIFISAEEAHHIVDVMRVRKTDSVVVFDGTGKEYIGFVKEVNLDHLVVEILEERIPAQEKLPAISLIQAMPKKDKMDYIVEKATELGVHSVIPVITDRTIVKWDQAKRGSHVSRWRKISREAAKQCGRLDLPKIFDIKDFSEVIKDADDYDLKLIAALSNRAEMLKDALADSKARKIVVAIGPEGDFTSEEVKLAKAAGFRLISLGSRVLKSDTAALAVLSILNYELS
jgi:16S rRNA (uracil1498-N3)-methyltransferase